jgi:cobalt-zinc-cadmium efflux system outer membrane protein
MRRKTRRSSNIAMGIGLACATAVAAADSAAEEARVDLLLSQPSQLTTWVEVHDRDVLAAVHRVGQARADVSQSRLWQNPSLSAGLSDVTVGETNPPGLGFASTAIYGLTLTQTLEIGKRGPRVAAARSRLGAEHETYLATLADAVGEARIALGRIVYLKARASAVEESLKAAQQMLALQRSRMENGDVSGNDLDRLVVDNVLLEGEAAENRSEYEAALSTCQAVLFAPCAAGDAGLATLESAVELPEALPADDSSALADRPDLRSLALAKESSLEDGVLARRRAIPDPSLSVGYTRDRLTISGDQPRTLLFGVSLPIPVFDHGQHDAAKAEQHTAELEASAAAAGERARAGIKALLTRRATLEHALGELEREAVPRSKSVLGSMMAALTQGDVSMTDLLLARRTDTDLALKVMDLQFDVFSTRSELRHALGLDAALVRKTQGESWTTQ